MRFEEAYEGWNGGRLTQAEAARILGVCERSFRRYLWRYEADGLDGLIDRRLEQASILVQTPLPRMVGVGIYFALGAAFFVQPLVKYGRAASELGVIAGTGSYGVLYYLLTVMASQKLIERRPATLEIHCF